jgi:thioredoxin-dependent peroxiredoxin
MFVKLSEFLMSGVLNSLRVQTQYCHRLMIRGMYAFVFCLMFATHSGAEEVEMKIGDPAPAFSLPDQNAVQRNLTDYRGQWLVLFFYPQDDTPGCTKEACSFRDDYFEIKKRRAEILGVSLDSEQSHAAFAKKFSLPFPLLADKNGVVAKQYGALWGIWPLRFASRHTFLIDPEGKIAKIYRDVDPNKHSDELIAAIDELAASKQ